MANDLKITASLQDNLSGGLNNISEALGKQKKKAEDCKKSLQTLSASAGNVKNSLSGLMSSLSSGNFIGFGQSILGATTAMGGLTGAMGTATGAAGGLGAALNLALGPVGLLVAGVAAITGICVSAGKAASDLDKNLDGLQSLTGLDDSSMKNMSKAAVDMSKDFKASAGDIVDSMKLIGSQAPQLLKDQEGLKAVTAAANTLAEAGQIGVVDAAKAITTTMNQMNVSASEASGIINTLAAASQQGAADIAYLNTAFEKTGTQAKSAGMSYSDLAAAIETVAPKFSSADVAGSKLEALLLALSVQANDNFKPAVVGMSQALDNLAAAELSDAQMKNMVGASQISMLKALIDGKEQYKDFTQTLKGTNTAYEMMQQNNDNLEGTLTKLKSSWDALMISLGQSALIQGIISLFQIFMDAVRDCINYISELIDELPGFGNGISIIGALGAAIKALTIPVKIVYEAIAVAVSLIINEFNMIVATVQWVWNKLKSIMSDMGISKPIQQGLTAVIDWFKKMIDYVLGLWNKFKKSIGMDVKEIKQKAVKLDDIPASTGNKNKKTDDPISNTITGKGTGKKTKVKVKVEAEADEGSLDALKKKMSDLQKYLTSKNLSVVDIEKTKKQIEDLQKEIDKKEIELGIKAKPGSLEYIENEISKIDDQLKKLDPKIDFAKIQELKLDKGALEDMKKEVEDALKEVVVEGKAFKSDAKEGSLKYARDRVSYYKTKIEYAVDDSDYQYWKKQYDAWKDKAEKLELKINADMSDAAKGSMKWLSEKKAYWQGKLDISVYGTPEYNEAMQHINELTKQENKIKLQMEIDGMTDLEKTFTMLDGFHAIDGVVSSFESLSNAINENASAWEIFMGILQAFESVMSAINAVTEIANMLSGISAGVKTAETAATVSASTAQKEKIATDTAAVAPTTAQTVANKALEASFLDLASAEIFAAHASIPFVGVSVATGFIATMLGVQKATKAATMAMMAFETGGIIGGNSYHGDKLIARVNSGEMILNGRQQRNLFDAINENRLGGENSNRLYGEVKIKGQDLYIALSNFGKVKSTLGKQIGIR